MPSGNTKLDALAAMLERAGDDPLRLQLVRRAQAFKRSWLELAQALAQLQQVRAYEAWGYADLHEYCNRELSIKPATVDKLVLSYGTLSRHAPEVLERDGVARPIPSVEAVDYFSRALGEDDGKRGARRLDASPDVLDDLRSAVFEQGHNVSELRSRFNPVLYPKPEGTEGQALWRRAREGARRLLELVRQIEQLSEARVARVEASLQALERDLDKLMAEPPVAAMKKSATRKAPVAAMKKGVKPRAPAKRVRGR
jgi:hypothetical protein